VDLDRGLVVVGGAERLRLLGRDRGVARDERGHHAAERLDAERQRRHVEQQHVLLLAGEHAALDGGADGDDLVGVHAAVRVLAEELLDDLLDLRDARRAADEDHLVDLVGAEPGVLERHLHRRDRALHEVVDELLELGARELDVEVLGARLVGRDEGQVDVGRLGRRQLHLRLLRGLLEALERHRVLRQVDALVALELLHEPVDDALVEVVAAEVGVAVGRLHLEDALGELEHRDVVGAAAEVEHGDGLFLLLVEAVGERRRGGLVDDAQHVEPGDLAGVLGGLALRVVEVGRHGDHGLGHRVAEVVLGGLLHLLQDHRRDLGRRVALALDLDGDEVVRAARDLVGHALRLVAHLVRLAPHEALDREDGVRGVGDGLALGDLPDQALAVLGEGDDRRRGAAALGVRDDDRVAPFEDRDHRVGGAEVDADDLVCHVSRGGGGERNCCPGDGQARDRPFLPARQPRAAAGRPGLTP
jgi:hypothetical protein